jgi:hypothetical protein
VLFSWVVPAKVGGRWRVESEDGNFTLDINQTFQSFAATAHVDKRTFPNFVEPHSVAVRDGRVEGPEIRFMVDIGEWFRVYRGRVEGDTIRGILPQGWKATRVAQ